MTPPCRCLLGDFPEGKELAELIADYVASLPEEFRAAPEEISRRLNVCRDCAELFDGTCRLCGCYVEARAAKAGMGCPAVPPRWEAVPPSIERCFPRRFSPPGFVLPFQTQKNIENRPRSRYNQGGGIGLLSFC